MEPTRLGVFIATRRNDLGLTQNELSAKVGKKNGYIQMVESGKLKIPPGTMLARIASALGVSLNDLEAAAGIRKFVLPAELVADLDRIAQLPDLDRQKQELAQLPEDFVQELQGLANTDRWELLRRALLALEQEAEVREEDRQK